MEDTGYRVILIPVFFWLILALSPTDYEFLLVALPRKIIAIPTARRYIKAPDVNSDSHA
jgi:hypothetical protein